VEANKILFMNIPAFLLALQDEGKTRDEWRLRRERTIHGAHVIEQHQAPRVMQDRSGNGGENPRKMLRRDERVCPREVTA